MGIPSEASQQGERVKTYIRIRPFLKREIENQEQSGIINYDTDKNQITSIFHNFPFFESKLTIHT